MTVLGLPLPYVGAPAGVLALETAVVDRAMAAGVVVLFLVVVALAAARTAVSRTTKPRAQAAAQEEGRRGQALLELVEDPAWINPVRLLTLTAQLVQSTMLGVLAARLLGPVGVVVATTLNVTLFFVLAEVGPTTWAIQNTDRAALRAARPVRALSRFLPLTVASRGLIGLSNVLLPGRGLERGPYVSEEELLAVADLAYEEDVIEATEREMIESVIELGDTVVREVMVPRTDMITVTSEFRVADAMEVVILNGYSRLPVSGTGIDDLVGIVLAKDLMRAERDGGEDRTVAELVRPARYVPETKRAAELLREMQLDRFHMAIVVDEYGGTAGLVTLEDIIEELLGEIVDEFDVEDPLIEPLPGGGAKVDARLRVDEANEVLHADLPEGDWDTVGGLLLSLLGRVPVVGETVDAGTWRMAALRVQGRRIAAVRLEPLERVPASSGRGADDGAEAHGSSRAGARRDGAGRDGAGRDDAGRDGVGRRGGNGS